MRSQRFHTHSIPSPSNLHTCYITIYLFSLFSFSTETEDPVAAVQVAVAFVEHRQHPS